MATPALDNYTIGARVYYLRNGQPEVWTCQGNYMRAGSMVHFLRTYHGRQAVPLYCELPHDPACRQVTDDREVTP